MKGVARHMSIKKFYVNSLLLESKIVESGLKTSYLCEMLGITYQGFLNKRKGLMPFRASEVFTLCSLLNINDEETKNQIFFP